MTTVTDGLVEVRRERLVRQTVYPRLVAQGKLTFGEAGRRMNALVAAEYWLGKLVADWDRVSVLIEGTPPVLPPPGKLSTGHTTSGE